ncbi:sugar phosphate nucleotidyltransferase [Dysgonomonas macrotermitis]|uniref:Nucleotidyl transferase n=1 Tax=Dysgonomonas macrotermitis TaxID=1346286 RepID=A0A1M5HUI2_9BACT|nr:sugar phosphate nucleotidyltransferase [Dysgonomonas macrotermitis]SHG19555.1 Nucleotidyl transferase [Dysgonomonas macrotermitis]
MKPTLFVLAAGMGSRYGGLKQLDGLGPNGETIMDYSIYDAVKSGFGKLVFVIRKSFEKEFVEKIASKYDKHIPVEIVFQELTDLPEGFTVHADRVKPWGTNHAVLMGKDVIKEPFAVINADDFYGRDGFETLAKFLTNLEGSKNHYCMVGYRLCNTLSESGSVARGVCETDKDGFLTSVVERTHIERKDGKIQYKDAENYWYELAENTPVSMNMWGFTPEYFQYSAEYFVKFLELNQSNLKAEYFIPLMVDHLITNKTADVKVLDTTSKWFGVTYSEDRDGVVAKLQQLADNGEYPSPLWK